MRLRRLWDSSVASRRSALGLVIIGAAGCVTDHDALARRDPPATGGTAGTSGSGGGGSSSSGSGNVPSQGASGGTDLPQDPDRETPGDDVVTILNGVVDADAVRLCFARPGITPDFVGDPLPTEPLTYGHSFALEEVPGFDWKEEAVQPWVIAGSLDLVEGLDCEGAIAEAESEEARVTPLPDDDGDASSFGGAENSAGAPARARDAAAGAGGEAADSLEKPKLRARPLPAFSPGTFSTGRSVLLALSGCMGGAAYRDPLATEVCGADYTPQNSTVQPLVVKLSRASGVGVGLQGVQASLATDMADLQIGGSGDALVTPFAVNLNYGRIAPRPPRLEYGEAELGLTRRQYGLQASYSGGVAFAETWPALLARFGQKTLALGRTYSVVLIGPGLGVQGRGFWNPSRLALIDNDPTRTE